MSEHCHAARPGAIVRIVNGFARGSRHFGIDVPEPDDRHLVALATRGAARNYIDSEVERFTQSVLASVNESGGLTPFGRFSARSILLRVLGNAQAIGRYVAEHPEILMQPVRQPVLVVGLYRSGTTLLHRLLASAAGVRAPTACELFYPIVEGRSGAELDRSRRWRMWKMLRLAHLAVPELRALHRIDVDSPEESTVLLDNHGLGVYFLHAFGAHTHGRRLAQNDLTGAYRSMRIQLQVLQSLSGRQQRWVLKCPFSLGHLDAFLNVFPDATIVHSHRDPAVSLSSVCRLAATLQSSFRKRVEPSAIGEFWLDNYDKALIRARIARQVLPEGTMVDVNYDTLVRHPLETVAQLSKMLHLEMDRNRLDAALSSTRHNMPVVPHHLSDYGLEVDRVRAQIGEIAVESRTA